MTNRRTALGRRGQVARCTKIINAGQDDAKYVINVRQIAKFVVGLGEKVCGARKKSSRGWNVVEG